MNQEDSSDLARMFFAVSQAFSAKNLEIVSAKAHNKYIRIETNELEARTNALEQKIKRLELEHKALEKKNDYQKEIDKTLFETEDIMRVTHIALHEHLRHKSTHLAKFKNKLQSTYDEFLKKYEQQRDQYKNSTPLCKELEQSNLELNKFEIELKILDQKILEQYKRNKQRIEMRTKVLNTKIVTAVKTVAEYSKKQQLLEQLKKLEDEEKQWQQKLSNQPSTKNKNFKEEASLTTTIKLAEIRNKFQLLNRSLSTVTSIASTTMTPFKPFSLVKSSILTEDTYNILTPDQLKEIKQREYFRNVRWSQLQNKSIGEIQSQLLSTSQQSNNSFNNSQLTVSPHLEPKQIQTEMKRSHQEIQSTYMPKRQCLVEEINPAKKVSKVHINEVVQILHSSCGPVKGKDIAPILFDSEKQKLNEKNHVESTAKREYLIKEDNSTQQQSMDFQQVKPTNIEQPQALINFKTNLKNSNDKQINKRISPFFQPLKSNEIKPKSPQKEILEKDFFGTPISHSLPSHVESFCNVTGNYQEISYDEDPNYESFSPPYQDSFPGEEENNPASLMFDAATKTSEYFNFMR